MDLTLLSLSIKVFEWELSPPPPPPPRNKRLLRVILLVREVRQLKIDGWLAI